MTGLPYDMIESGEGGLLRVAGELVPNSVPLSEVASDEVWLLSDSPGGNSRYLRAAKSDDCSKVVLLLVF